jgi:hypothetical protein
MTETNGTDFEAAPDWLIWYGDGSSFSSHDGSAWQTPREDVQVVFVKDVGCGVMRWHGFDWYCWEPPGEWVPHDTRAMHRYLITARNPLVIAAYAIPYRKFTQIYTMAVLDERMPTKGATDPREPGAPV